MNEKICRLCLQTISSVNCQTIEEPLLKFLNLNTNISKENVMCIECASCLRVFSNFTSGHAYKEDETLPLSALDDGVKLDPEAIETTTNLKSLRETEIKCSFCTRAHGREDLISIKESKENKFMVNVLERYILEKNLKNAEELLACETCLESLEGVSSVILKCSEVEEKISKYVELVGTDDRGQVELKEVQQFTFKPVLKSESKHEVDDSSDQVQEEYAMMAEAEIKCEKEVTNTELIIKTEDVDITSEQSNIKLEDSDCDGFQELLIENKNASEMKMFSCELCPFQTKWQANITRHLLTHKNPSEIKMFKCEMCPFETKHKHSLKTHLLTHKSSSEIKMFKCEICSYEVKRKYELKGHLMTHKSPSEIKMFKCKLCSYEAKRKTCIKRHLLTHKSPSEIKMFKCELCSYEAKRKVYLKQHLLTHKRRSEVKMFKCALCSYEAKQKRHLRDHLSTHKSPSETEMFKCELCSYEAKRRICLIRHLFTHKSPSKIKMFKCELCSYEAKRKVYLKQHLLTHKSPSEVKMFQCEFCSYQTKWKKALPIHLLTHKDSSNIKMFKCELCSYETKHKICLKRHLLTHKSPPEMKMFHRKSNSKITLDNATITQRSSSEIGMIERELYLYKENVNSVSMITYQPVVNVVLLTDNLEIGILHKLDT